ncbi:12444_t:CDS:2 [Funneliformis geosporum]
MNISIPRSLQLFRIHHSRFFSFSFLARHKIITLDKFNSRPNSSFIFNKRYSLTFDTSRRFFCKYGSYHFYTTSTNFALEPKETPIEWRTFSFYSFNWNLQASLQELRENMLSRLEEMGIVGRIYIASEGINAQVSCPIEKLEELRKYCDEVLNLNDVVFNFSTYHVKAFRKLHVKARNKIVADGLESGLYDLSKQPYYLAPEEWHKALSNAKEPPLLIDMRNHYERQIGYFVNSVRPDVDTFRDSIKAMNEICEGKQNEEIYMYCTGGIRCSKAGSILLSKGFKSVKMLKGGITAYGRFVKDNPSVTSLYKGRNFTFDKRLGEPITNDIISQCHTCGKPCDTHTNCRNKTCNLLFIQCEECKIRLQRTCGTEFCLQLIQAWDEKYGKPSTFDDVKPGLECVYDHVHRTRPKLVIKRLGGTASEISTDIIPDIIEQRDKQIKNE